MGVPTYTISNSSGIHSESHSRREYTPFSAEPSLSYRNVTIYDCGDDRKHINDFFRPYIQTYNDVQKRQDRKKSYVDDYCSAIESGEACYGTGNQKEHLFHHEVVQIGNRTDLGLADSEFNVDYWRNLKRENRFEEAAKYVAAHLNKDPNRDVAKKILIDALQEFKAECQPGKRFSNVLLHGIEIHDDEISGTCHADIRYSIYTDGEKKGLPCRLSDHKGLKKMGFETDRTTTGLQKFREEINSIVEEKMRQAGFERKYINEHRKHLSTAQFEAVQKIKEAEEKADEIIQFAKSEAQQIVDGADDERARLDVARQQYQEKKIELIDAMAGSETMDKTILEFLNSEKGKQAFYEYLDSDLIQIEPKDESDYEPDVPSSKHVLEDADVVQQDTIDEVRDELDIPKGLDAMQAVRFAQKHMNDGLKQDDGGLVKKKKSIPVKSHADNVNQRMYPIDISESKNEEGNYIPKK